MRHGKCGQSNERDAHNRWPGIGEISKHPECDTCSNPADDGKQYSLIFYVRGRDSLLNARIDMFEMTRRMDTTKVDGKTK